MKKLKSTANYLTYWVDRYGHLLLPLSASILSFVSTYILFGPVLNRSGDNIYHLMNEYAMMHGVNAGDNILGPLGIEMGQPVLRFYQSLFYLLNVVMHFLTKADLTMIHNITLCLSFGLSPFSFYYFMRKLKVNKWTSGLASYMTLISVAAFGNSFEAFFQAGIVTQALGGLFFPWFMGAFIGMLRGENSPVTTGLLFALAFLSHAIMAVYATFVGALYFFMSESSIKANIKRVIIFGALGASLVSFWVIPFIEHNKTMRPVPDPIFRGSGVHWYTSVSTAELIDVATNGYMLDDARHKGNDRNETEKFMDKINIIGSLSFRPPVFSILTAIGIFFSLFRLRQLSTRFLLGGFAFSLMLFAGPDDFRWTAYLPFMDKVQAFRCTYLFELFAFGLSALGIETIVGTIYTFGRKRVHWWGKVPVLLIWASMAAAVVGWTGYEIIKLGQTHLLIREPNILNMDLDALQNIPDKGYPYKVDPKTGGRPKIRHAWFAMHGYMPFCTHWKGTGPEASFKQCSILGNPQTDASFLALSGVRWYSGWGPGIKTLAKQVDEDQLPTFKQIDTGKDRNGKNNSSRITLDTDFREFLRPLIGSPLPVVCNDKQWLWLTDNWMRTYKSKLWQKNMPVTMRVTEGTLSTSELLTRAKAIFYFDHNGLSNDLLTLKEFEKKGGKIISPIPIDGLNAVVLGLDESPWLPLPAEINNAPNSIITDREEIDPGLAVSNIKMLKPSKHTYQNFAFDVENIEPIIAVLPLEKYPGWKAFLNGKEVPVFATGPDLIGVHLNPGAHRLFLKWEMPLRDKATIYLSLLALLFTLGYFITRTVKKALNPRYIAPF
ncbi:MAG: hypothetical protein JXR91_14160 [Deltaproteobacteria bacterium]|nr:hypothetical protein [Deltaproteobacteria bacterium]